MEARWSDPEGCLGQCRRRGGRSTAIALRYNLEGVLTYQGRSKRVRHP